MVECVHVYFGMITRVKLVKGNFMTNSFRKRPTSKQQMRKTTWGCNLAKPMAFKSSEKVCFWETIYMLIEGGD